MIDGTAECMHTYNQQLNHMTNLTPFFFAIMQNSTPTHNTERQEYLEEKQQSAYSITSLHMKHFGPSLEKVTIRSP